MRSRQKGPFLFVGAAVGLMFMCFPVLAQQDQPKAPAKSVAQESGDPTKLKPEEIRTIWEAMAEKPAFRYPNGLDLYMSLRQAELAQELGMRAWTVDFEGGPFLCWLDTEEERQKTRRWRPEQEGGSINWSCSSEKGRLLLWFLPVASETNSSERSRKIMKLLKTADRFATAIPEVFGLKVIGGPSVTYELLGEPKVPALWSTWNDVSIKEVSSPTPVKVSGELTLLQVEATEKGQAKGTQPRKLKLTLKAKPQSK
jgi:hypothetical protein